MNNQALERKPRNLREANRVLDQARAAAENASQAKSDFLAHISHEIRNLLNVMLGLVQLLNREPLPTRQRDMVTRIQQAGQSLLGIVNDILDFSRIETGPFSLKAQPFALDALMAKLASLLGHAAGAKGLTLCIGAPPVPMGPLVGDALRLEQILVNLISNAIKFTERGEVAVEVEVCELSPSAVHLRFAVRDTGIGIAPEALDSLFTPFFQAEAGMTRRFDGIGLGLPISWRLVEMMGGTMGVDSQPGEGSVLWFELSLPRTKEDIPVATDIPHASRSSRPPLAGRQILVVDDSPGNRHLIEQALTGEGATVVQAADGRQAIERLRAQPNRFDLVLMDMQMPVLDGLAATRAIRHDLGLTHLPILACTAAVFPEQQAAARAAGANEVLVKPLNLDQLPARLSRWTGDGPLPDPDPDPPPSAESVVVEEWPELPGIDRAQVARILGRQRTLFLPLLEELADAFADIAAQTRQDVAQGERDAAARRLHKLRGNAGMLGAKELVKSAEELEAAVLAADAADLEDPLTTLDQQLAALITASAPWRAGDASAHLETK